METSDKKILLTITYYATIILAFASSILFMVSMTMRGVVMYQQIVYYIWAILLIATLIFDIIATNTNSLKFIVGLIVISLAFLCVVMGIIVFAGMSVAGAIPYYAIGRFSLVIGYSIVSTILTIIAYCVGLKLTKVNRDK